MNETGVVRQPIATGTRHLATGLLATGLILTAAGLALFTQTHDVPVRVFGVRDLVGLFAFTFGPVGWLIVTRYPRNPVGWFFVAVALLVGLQVFCGEYGIYSEARHAGSWPFTTAIEWIQSWIWVPGAALITVFTFLLFPDGKLLSRRWRFVVVGSVVSTLVMAVVIALTPGQLDSAVIGATNPIRISQSAADKLASGALLFTLSLIASITSLILRFRRSRGEEHEQMKWLVLAASVAALSLVASFIVEIPNLGAASSWTAKLVGTLVLVSVSGIAVAAGIAIVTRGLYDIDIVINRALVFAALAAFITVIYLAVVVGIGAAVGKRSNVGLSVLATAIIALTIQPVRNRANLIANKVVFGDRASPYEALSLFGERIAGAFSAEEALPQLARLMTEATSATRASVWLNLGDIMSVAAVWPPNTAAPDPVPVATAVSMPGFDHTYPVEHQGELLGALAVETPPSEPLNATQEKLLGDLASQAALVMRNERLIAELQASRQRLVATADQERRRIERNLHDGAQQHLVALSVKIGLAKQILGSNPQAAGGILEELKTDAGEALQELRDLARGIYPPLLADEGLKAALGAQVRKAAIPVDVEVDGIGRYPPETESAVYFCVLEALQNISKYAGATRASVSLRADAGRLEFTITDDGAGFDPRTVKRGAGLTNMSDRLEALGGRLDIASSPGSGTTVTGWVKA